MRLAHISARPGGVREPALAEDWREWTGSTRFGAMPMPPRSKSPDRPAVRCTCQPCASSPPDANQPVLGTAGLWT